MSAHQNRLRLKSWTLGSRSDWAWESAPVEAENQVCKILCSLEALGFATHPRSTNVIKIETGWSFAHPLPWVPTQNLGILCGCENGSKINLGICRFSNQFQEEKKRKIPSVLAALWQPPQENLKGGTFYPQIYIVTRDGGVGESDWCHTCGSLC